MKNQCLLLRLLPEEREILTWILKAKSPGKKLRDQNRLNQFKAKRRLWIVGLCSTHALIQLCKPEEKGSVTEDSGIDLDFSERMDKLNQTKTISKNSDFYKLLHVLNLLVSTSNIAISLQFRAQYDSIK